VRRFVCLQAVEVVWRMSYYRVSGMGEGGRLDVTTALYYHAAVKCLMVRGTGLHP